MDWIEKDLAGVVAENNDENEQARRQQQQHGGDDDDEHDDNEQDDFYEYIRKQQEAQRRYREMQQEVERAMQQELKRQAEQRREFQNHCRNETKKCRQATRDKGLHTIRGREQAHQVFQTRADKILADHTEQKTTNPEFAQDGPPTSSPQHQQGKPQYDIMECNANRIVVALRKNMPQVVFEIMNQELPTFAQQKGRELHFSGIQVTVKRIKMEYMLQPLDDDQNNLLHYAIYYESYQIINMICATATRDGYLEAILEQPNARGNTPLFFARLADDASILKLVEYQFQAVEEINVKTKVGPALEAAGKRLETLLGNIGFFSVLDTLLSLGVAHFVFDLHLVVSIVALFLTNVVHKDSKYEEEVTGLHALAVHMSFCVLWNACRCIFVQLVSKYIRWEFLLLLIPFAMVALFARPSRQNQSTDWVDRVLSPLLLHAKVSDQVERYLILGHEYLIPQWVLKHGAGRSFLLFMFTMSFWGAKRFIVAD